MKRLGMSEARVLRFASGRSRSIKRFSSIAVGLLIVSTFAVAAQAGPVKKQFTADVQPGIVNGSLVNASGYATFTALVQNLNQSQQLGSAQFTVPPGSGFSIADGNTPGATNPIGSSGTFVYPCDAQPSSSTTPCAEIMNGGSTIEFDNLSLQNGQTFSGTFSVNVPAECVDQLPWTVRAHQANNFSANPGNFYTGPANVPTTTVVTTCKLNWTTQPADAEPSTTITGVAGTPPSSTNLITVTVQNSGGTTILGANIGITLALRDLHNYGGHLGGTTSSLAANGVATFSPTIDTVGNYRLQATSEGVTCSAGASPTCGTSNVFSIVDDISGCTRHVSCPTINVAHSSIESGSTVAPNPPENNGHVIVAFDIWQDLSCALLGYTPINDSVTFEYIPSTPGNITPINGTYSVPHSSTNQVCFASVTNFSNTKKGFTTPDGQKTISITFDGVPYFVGVLDVCSRSNPAPCYNKSTGQQIDTFTIVGRDVDDMVGRS